VLTIRDHLIEDFLESDIEVVARYYNRTMAPEIELTRKFGDRDLKDVTARIQNEYEHLREAAKGDPDKVRALGDQLEADLRDVAAMRDMLLGTFGAPADPANAFVRFGKAARQVNYIRLLGGMTLSAIPDLARPVMGHGLRRYGKALTQLAAHPRKFRMAMKEAKLAGAGWDMVLNSRAAAIADVGDIYGVGNRFERGLRAVSDTFGVPSLMAPWNAAMKQFSGVIVAHRVLEESLKATAGKLGTGSARKLAQMGIDEAMARRIGAQFRQFGDEGDVLLARAHEWTDREAARTFTAAVLKDVDTVIVTPGVGDRPLWMGTETGKLLGQFKSFAFAATNRVLLSGLQQRDAAAVNGMLLTVALGAVVYGVKARIAGYEVSTDPGKVITEALDRSGMFGYLFEVNNIVEKATRGRIGVSALSGGPTMSRYASRNVLGSLIGPTGDVIGDFTQVTAALSTGDVRASDVHAVRKLLPYQNLFYTRQLLDQLERGAVEASGIPE